MARSVASDDALCHQQCPYGQIAHHSIGVLPSPSSFMNLLWLLSSLLGFLLPSSCICINRCCSLTLLVCSFIVSFLSRDDVSTWKQSWYPSRMLSGSLAESDWLFLLHPYTALMLMRLINFTFSFLFCLGVILIYSPRSYEAGAFLSFGPAWTASGLGQ